MILIDGNPAVDVALLRTQVFKDEAEKLRMRLAAQGKDPRRSKKVAVAEAEYFGALTVLAHVLGTAGADVLIEGRPSHTLTGLYLEQWDKLRHAKAFRRVTQRKEPA